MKKIIILGCPASGKTTLGIYLSEKFSIPLYHLDKIFWVQKGGIKQDIFLEKQMEIMSREKWIIDGNFLRSTSYEVRLQNADTIIFFYLSKAVIFLRLIKRYFKYFNKKRPDSSSESRFHIDWHIIKFIWNYPSDEEFNKISAFAQGKRVYIIRSLRDEIRLMEEIKSFYP